MQGKLLTRSLVALRMVALRMKVAPIIWMLRITQRRLHRRKLRIIAYVSVLSVLNQ